MAKKATGEDKEAGATREVPSPGSPPAGDTLAPVPQAAPAPPKKPRKKAGGTRNKKSNPGDASSQAPIASESAPGPDAVSAAEQTTTESPASTKTPPSVIMITPELTPVAKVGGIADVVTGMFRALLARRVPVEVILPKYDNMRYDLIQDLHICFNDLWVPWHGGGIHCSVWSGKVEGNSCLFIDPHGRENYFNRGMCYGQHDDVLRFAFFCKAALEFILHSGRRPDILHCHDWHTSLVPVLLYEMYQHSGLQHQRVCLTIHNFKHQGEVGDIVLHATGLHRPEHFMTRDRLLDNHKPGRANLLKGGIVYSNFVVTVSPMHAWETRCGGQAFGLEPTLNEHQQKFGGILNGIDYDYWNPAADRHIPHHYTGANLDLKYKNKSALRQRLMLAEGPQPIVAYVGRLDAQKGIDLIRHSIHTALRLRAQFVLLGTSPDPGINNSFGALKRQLNDNPNCHLEINFDEELAHLIYAGADMLLVPSIFEPCGLTQIIALRYGTIPVVRHVGGLADTVFDKDYSDKPQEQRNGFVFRDANGAAVDSTLDRAISCYYGYPGDFRRLMLNAIGSDHSWGESISHYLNIYNFIRA